MESGAGPTDQCEEAVPGVSNGLNSRLNGPTRGRGIGRRKGLGVPFSFNHKGGGV